MRGVTFLGNRQAEIREFPDPHAGPGEAVVKIRASGLGGTDLHSYRGSEPAAMITGHEPCGVIEELGPGAPPALAIGDRVMCHHYAGCGGVVIIKDGAILGGIGVGGLRGHSADEDLAKLGLEAMNL